jgi:phage terminase small subunit
MPGTYKSGRKPVPTNLHILRGTLRSRHKTRPRPPQLGRPEPTPEIQADDVALGHWTALCERLETLRILSPAHGEALGLLAQALADYGRVRAQLHEMGYRQLIVDEMRDKEGKVTRRRVRENPLIRRSERLALLVSRLLGEFGLTPITQTKIAAIAPSEADPFEAFLGGKR